MFQSSSEYIVISIYNAQLKSTQPHHGNPETCLLVNILIYWYIFHSSSQYIDMLIYYSPLKYAQPSHHGNPDTCLIVNLYYQFDSQYIDMLIYIWRLRSAQPQEETPPVLSILNSHIQAREGGRGHIESWYIVYELDVLVDLTNSVEKSVSFHLICGWSGINHNLNSFGHPAKGTNSQKLGKCVSFGYARFEKV